MGKWPSNRSICCKVSDMLIMCTAVIDIGGIAFSGKQAIWGLGGSRSVSASRSLCLVTGDFSMLVFFYLAWFSSCALGALHNAISNILGPRLDLLYQAKYSLQVPHTLATARICLYFGQAIYTRTIAFQRATYSRCNNNGYCCNVQLQ